MEVACGGGHGGGGVGGGGVDRVVRWGAFFFGVLELRCEFAFLSGMWKLGSLPRAPFPPYRCVLSPCLITVPYRYTLSLQPGCMWWRLWAVEVACGGGHGGGGVGG